MTESALVQTKLHNQTEADESEVFVKNSRYYYRLFFTKKIGWDWIYSQVCKVSAKIEESVELYEIEPSGDGLFSIIVREVGRRPNIDDSQGSLFDYS